MRLARNSIALVNYALKAADVAMVRRSTLDMLLGRIPDKCVDRSTALPPDAEDYLRHDNPRLVQLKQRYSQHLSELNLGHSRWTPAFLERRIDLHHFRGHNAYISQVGPLKDEINYQLTMYYVQKIDRLELLKMLSEDGLFGAYTFNFNDNMLISRDLMDSIMEIHFLDEHLSISSLSDLTVLDVGAGYGRLAHRLVTGLPNVTRFYLTDAVAESTFLADFYLSFRGVSDRAIVVPFYEIETVLEQGSIDLAINTHSFSECPLKFIEWWLNKLKQNRVKHLMLVPNPDDHGGAKLLTTENGDRLDYFGLVESKGYRLKVKQTKYKEPVLQKFGIVPTHYYLFELSR